MTIYPYNKNIKINPETRELLKHIGTFNVKLCGLTDIIDGFELLPAHKYVLSPLLSSASECRVYGIKKNSNLFEYVKPIISEYKKGCTFLDLTKEVVKGYERLWNADSFERSSIVVVTNYDAKKMRRVLSHCGKPQIWASHHQLNMSQSKAAICYCQSLVRNKEIAILLAHEMKWMDLFADGRQLLELFKISQLQGKSFKIAPIPKSHIHPRIITLVENAIADRDFKKVKTLVEQNSDLIKLSVFDLRSQRTLLHVAAHFGDAKIAEYLISKGANVNTRDREGMTPLHSTLCRKDNIAELLISKGADIHAVDFPGWTPFHYVCNYNLKESARLLLAYGANINIQDKKGYTPLDLVLRRNYEISKSMADFLRRNGGKSWSDLKK